ncbi:MAG: hypothetical protein E7510_14165 [Ruminococcus sp.]|nr:hypothetical protein [Ruminococcus sp.]
MSRIKTKDNEKNIKVFDKTVDIAHNMKAGYIKAKTKTNRNVEENNGSTYEYANEILEDMTDEASSSAQSFAKSNFKKSVQKKRALDSEKRVNVIKSKDVPIQNMYTNNTPRNNTIPQKSMVARAKDRFVKNSIKAKTVGATTIKEKIVGFIKRGSTAAATTAKLAIANTKILIAALMGTGGIAILFTIIICIIGLVMGSSFGIFMATEDTGTGYTLNTVIQEINEEYLAEIEKIKTEVPHDDFEMSDTTPNWKDILAIYAVKVTTAEDGAEVVTVDEEKAELIREVFWDMTEIIYETEPYEDTDTIETTDDQGNTIEQEVTVTKTRLFIDIQNKTATDVAVEYGFNESQFFQLNELTQTNNKVLWEDLV